MHNPVSCRRMPIQHELEQQPPCVLDKQSTPDTDAGNICTLNYVKGALSSAGLLQACWRCGARWQHMQEPWKWTRVPALKRWLDQCWMQLNKERAELSGALAGLLEVWRTLAAYAGALEMDKSPCSEEMVGSVLDATEQGAC